MKLIVLLFAFFWVLWIRPDMQAFHITGTAQGTTYHITYYSDKEIIAKKEIDAILDNIDSSLSIYKTYSLISRFNNSQSGIQMDKHLKFVVERSLRIYKETGGISDITVFPLVRAWGFGTAKVSALPDAAAIRSIMQCVGSSKLRIEGNKLIKTNPCVKIDVNGIAQGYSVDVLARFLEQKKIQSYMVEIGGEIRVKGLRYPAGDKYHIGIESPAENSFSDPVIQTVVRMDKGAITTSGNYRKYTQLESKKISHLMDPRTGYPVQNEMISVTLAAPDAISADGYDNALMGMGLKGAFSFLEKHPEMQAYIIYHRQDGTVKDTATAGFYKLIDMQTKLN